MASQRTVLEVYASDEFTFAVEKWWTPMHGNADIEVYVGVGIAHFRPGEEQKADVVLLSLDRAEALANKILDVVRKSR